MAENNIKINSTNYGMDLDSLPQYIKQGDLSYALNANIQSNESSLYTYTNEPSNILCSFLKPGFIVINNLFIREQNKTIYFLVNPNTGESEIGQIVNSQIKDDGHIFQEDINETQECLDCKKDVLNSNHPILHPKLKENCKYETIINPTCLNFDINHPIKSVYKILDCGTIIYFVDGHNPDRYINLNKLPYKRVSDPSCLPLYSNEIDCNLLNFYPDIQIPEIQVEDVLETGSLEWGSYQFALSYSNSSGNQLSKFFSITNIVPIIDKRKLETDFGQASSKSIKLNISNLERDAYQYYNLYVIKTVRNVTSVELVETLPTTANTYVYTGNNKTQIQIPVQELFKDFPLYNSNLIATSNGYLLRGDLKSSPYYNWQKAVSKIKLNWISYKQKYRETNYSIATETTNRRTFQRDEVQPLGLVFLLTNGQKTNAFVLVSREKTLADKEVIPSSNLDNLNIDKNNNCNTLANTDKEKWQVYNTATITKNYNLQDVPCESQPYQEGEFAYWESTEKYPCNKEIWGELADKPIRHFKFPDNSISHIHDATYNFQDTWRDSYYKENHIYPIGIKIDEQSLALALLEIPIEERALIQGYEVVRGNRVNNKSVIAKGLVYNVGLYNEFDEKNNKIESHYYPNYPFNDLHKDPFLYEDRSIYTTSQPTLIQSKLLSGFGEEAKSRMTFHSPDTHFYNPGLGSILKLETEETGIAKSVIKEVQEHAKYKFLTVFDNYVAYVSAVMVVTFWAASTGASGIGISGNPVPMVIDVFQKVIDIIRISIPYRNYCYQINSVGNYNSYLPVGNTGNKQRRLEIASYLGTGGFQYTGDNFTVNQYHRESSVYLKTDNPLPFPTTNDYSRYSPDSVDEQYNRVSAYYASIKRFIPDQYSTIDNIEWVSTGHYERIGENGQVLPTSTIFGGDTYITKFALKRKLRYFNDDRVGFPNEADIDYEFTRNISNPIYYFNTSSPELSTAFNSPNTGATGIANLIQAFNNFIGNVSDLAKMFLKLPKLNLDDSNMGNPFRVQEKGRMYLFNYGLPYFFVESDVNTEFRFAENEKERDFYPRMSPELDIPNNWLQEKNVPILHDNSYIYNKDYSKQIKEHAYSVLPNEYISNICKYVYPNRVVYSEQSVSDESYDKWLIFKANNFYDFPRENGRLKILKGIDNIKILSVFEHNFSVYNAYSTIQTSAKDAIVGNGGMFATPPLEYNKSEIGYGGTSNSVAYTTNFGTFWTDSKRGKIYVLNDGLTEISDSKFKLERWLTDNLSFKIREYFPSVYTDNAYKGIGYSTGWDEKNSRFFLTKLDYEPITPNVAYDEQSQNFYDKVSNKPISLLDTKYFCNKSFTLAYKADVQRWVSFYSFHPNFYTSFNNHFQTGVNGKGVWNHLLSNKFYQTFYGEISPYVIEYVVNNGPNTRILESIQYSQEVKEYYGDNEYYSIPDGSVNFTKAYIYNENQCTGILNLIKRPINNLQLFMSYPKFNQDSKDILYAYYENKYNFNNFWDITKNYKNRQPLHVDSCNGVYDKVLNPLFHDYGSRPHEKNRIRGQYSKVRLIQDSLNRYKFINYFEITMDQNSM